MKKKRWLLGISLVLISLLALVQKSRAQQISRMSFAPGNAMAPANARTAERSVIETISASGRSQLTELLTRAGLISYLSGHKPFTLFAPSEAAMAVMAQYPPEKLRGTLLYHLVPGRYALRDLKEGTKLRTMTGEEITVLRRRDFILVNGVPIARPNEAAANGFIHTLDGALTGNW